MLNYFEIGSLAWKVMSYIYFSIYSLSGYLVQWKETVLAILAQGHERNIFAKFLAINLRGDVVRYFSSGGNLAV